MTRTSQEILQSDSNKYSQCEASNCEAKATIIAIVGVGPKEAISLKLCEECTERFNDIRSLNEIGQVGQSSQQEPTYPDRADANPSHESTGIYNG